MSGDDYGGNRRFGRGGGGDGDFSSRGRRDRGRGFGGSGRGRSNFESNESKGNFGSRRSYEEENNDDWEDNGTSGNNYGSGNAFNRGSGGGHRRDSKDDFDNEVQSDEDSSYRGGGRGSVRFSGRNDGDSDGNRRTGFGRGGDRFRDDNRRGGGRGRGGRNSGPENGYNRNRGDDEDDEGSPSRMRGRRRDGEEKNGEEKDDKPKERYIPPDPTDDEDVMFGSGITSGINFSKYENIRVKISGENSIPPINKFEDAGLRELIYSNVKKSGYTIPTPIQKYAIPTIIMGRDLMACAQTGSGKTAAFLIPIINSLLESPSDLVITSNSVEPQAVILSPTRELTIQIFNEARKFAHGSIIKVSLAYGGTATYHQANALMRGCHILVATPGRLNDFVSRGRVSFGSVRFFVLDEADRMLDMGFKPEIEKMLLHETMVHVGHRQTMMFSATFPEDIQRMALNYLHNYLFVAVGIVGGACSDVEQIFHEVSRFDKKEKLKEILSQAKDKEKTLVFVEQKRTADFIAALLSENGFPTTSIHGDRLQSQREMALNDFKIGRMPTLVATAVAARGLDIKNVGHVINYDLPSTIEEYVHRIGRTGRVGNRGKATSFYDSGQDSALARALVTILEQTNQDVPAFLSEGYGERSSGGNGGFSNEDQSFGGRDVRRGPSRNVAVEPASLEEEEEW